MGECEICGRQTSVEGTYEPVEDLEKYYIQSWEGEQYEFCSIDHLMKFAEWSNE